MVASAGANMPAPFAMPLMVIFALLAFGQLVGFVGVLLALPISAVLLVAGRRLRAQYLQSDLYNA